MAVVGARGVGGRDLNQKGTENDSFRSAFLEHRSGDSGAGDYFGRLELVSKKDQQVNR
jgi:hypothetical protein